MHATFTVKKGGGKAMLKTVEGEDLTVEVKDGEIWVWDAKGDAAKITIKNVMQSNGVIHVIDTSSRPNAAKRVSYPADALDSDIKMSLYRH